MEGVIRGTEEEGFSEGIEAGDARGDEHFLKKKTESQAYRGIKKSRLVDNLWIYRPSREKGEGERLRYRGSGGNPTASIASEKQAEHWVTGKHKMGVSAGIPERRKGKKKVTITLKECWATLPPSEERKILHQAKRPE